MKTLEEIVLINHRSALASLSLLHLTNYFMFFISNSETIMFLHQIFYQGLKARIASWPTLVLGKFLSSMFQLC